MPGPDGVFAPEWRRSERLRNSRKVLFSVPSVSALLAHSFPPHIFLSPLSLFYARRAAHAVAFPSYAPLSYRFTRGMLGLDFFFALANTTPASYLKMALCSYRPRAEWPFLVEPEIFICSNGTSRFLKDFRFPVSRPLFLSSSRRYNLGMYEPVMICENAVIKIRNCIKV